MLVKPWNKLPSKMQVCAVRPYWESLRRKNVSLFFKRIFDIVMSALILIVLSPCFLIIAIAIKVDSSGPVFYRQVRVTQYGKEFQIHKFRSMYDSADKDESLVTIRDDSRVTKVGRFIRKYKFDEFPQLIDVLHGELSFVGTRPEVPKYVNQYTPEMLATLLLPAGITSEASIQYKNESELIANDNDVDKIYLETVLPIKMMLNLEELKKENFFHDIKVMFITVFSVFII